MNYVSGYDQPRQHIQRRQRHPTWVLLPGKSHGWRSLVGCGPWGHWKSDTAKRLDFHFHTLEKEMATHSSVLAWRIPGMGEHGGLPSMGSHRVRHDWSDLAAAANSILKSRDVTLPRKVHLGKAMVFPVVMYECASWDYKKSWAQKNWCFWTVVLEKTLESPLD